MDTYTFLLFPFVKGRDLFLAISAIKVHPIVQAAPNWRQRMSQGRAQHSVRAVFC